MSFKEAVDHYEASGSGHMTALQKKFKEIQAAGNQQRKGSKPKAKAPKQSKVKKETKGKFTIKWGGGAVTDYYYTISDVSERTPHASNGWSQVSANMTVKAKGVTGHYFIGASRRDFAVGTKLAIRATKKQPAEFLMIKPGDLHQKKVTVFGVLAKDDVIAAMKKAAKRSGLSL